MSDQNINPNFNSNIEDEISLKDIIDFLVESWTAILATGVLGVLATVTYVIVTPNKYEATAQIEMARVSNNNNNNNSNPLGSNIEDPNLLIARMKSPSSYDKEAIAACGYQLKKVPAQDLAKMAKFSLIKGTQMVEVKVQGLSSEQATQCAESIFRIVKDSQKAITEPIIDEAKAKIQKYSQRLQEAQSFIGKADKSGSSMSAAYLSTRDEVSYLTDEMIRLNDLISSANLLQTKLVSPIYSPENKVSPKYPIVLIAGLFAGLFLGLLLMLGKRGYKAYKASNKRLRLKTLISQELNHAGFLIYEMACDSYQGQKRVHSPRKPSSSKL
jgi:capsular polysaccharide biosynthesis protein